MAKSLYIGSVQSGEHDDEDVELMGWVHRHRSSGKIVFLTLRDSTGSIQCVIRKGAVEDEVFDAMRATLVESSVRLSGRVKVDERAPGGHELGVTAGEVVGAVNSERPYPITESTVDVEDASRSEFLLDHRHLDLRSTRMVHHLRLRSAVFGAIHSYFRERDYLEFQAPSFVSGATEGGSTLFELPYFGQTMFLTQSWQLYAEAGASALERIYCVAPSFRAEKSRTRRHLTEFWHAEMELAWAGNADIMDHGEALVQHVCRVVLDTCSADLEALGRDPSDLERWASSPFPRRTYSDCVAELQAKGVAIEWGEDLDYSKEKILTEDAPTPFFVTGYPAEAKPFYHRPNPEDPTVMLCHDLLAPEGYGEIIGGGERTYTEDEILSRMAADGLDPEPYSWYVDIRRYGGVPHGGFGLGVDRLVAWLAGAESIREVIPFPRTSRRVTP